VRKQGGAVDIGGAIEDDDAFITDLFVRNRSKLISSGLSAPKKTR